LINPPVFYHTIAVTSTNVQLFLGGSENSESRSAMIEINKAMSRQEVTPDKTASFLDLGNRDR
jgi:hypothetical protein